MAFIAQKFCTFAGRTFRVGEAIPAELIKKGAIPRLKQAGKIAETAEGPLLPSAASLEECIPVNIIDGENALAITMTKEELVEVVEIAQMGDDDIIAFIQRIEHEEQLILIDALAKSDAVYEAAAKKAKELNPEEADTEAEPVKEIPGHLDKEQLASIKYNDLRKMAKEMGLETDGTKEELIDRIAAEEVMVPVSE